MLVRNESAIQCIGDPAAHVKGMALFSSKTPRDLNHDPTPWIAPSFGRGPYNFDGRDVFDPRPEFDHLQHHAPNPILVAFRGFAEKHGMAPDEVQNLAQQWVKRASYYEHHLNIRARSATKAQREHARRVLSRLAPAADDVRCEKGPAKGDTAAIGNSTQTHGREELA